MKKVLKFILVSIVIIILIVGVGGCILIRNILGSSNTNTISDIEMYLNHQSRGDIYAQSFMPKLEELSEHEDISYSFTEESGIFPWTSYVLVVKYDDVTYEREKNRVCEDYDLIKKEMKLGDEKDIVEPYFHINSYDFRQVDYKKDKLRDFPKFFGLIGTSDETNSIAYLYYCDSELDYIDNIEEFVKEHFHYEF